MRVMLLATTASMRARMLMTMMREKPALEFFGFKKGFFGGSGNIIML